MDVLEINDLQFSDDQQPFSANLPQYSVIMGANGSGKSRLLYQLMHAIKVKDAGAKIVFIEGGRQANIDVDLAVDNDMLKFLSNPDEAEKSYLQNRTSSLNVRMRTVLKVIRSLDSDKKAKHSDAVSAWIANGSQGEAPKREELPFDRLSRVFSAVFPNLKIHVTPVPQLYIRKGKIEYPAMSMSDGEKQIFMLVADLLSLKAEQSVFLIDEPELNLHPSLAESFWSVVEGEFPTSTFIYASHSISFALRNNIQTVYVIGFGEVDREHLFNHEQIVPFLGSLPKMIGKHQCLLVEGADSSLDSRLYRWLTSRDDFSVLPIGGSSEVILASAREGLWSGLKSSIGVLGVVDRDFKPSNLNYKNCVMLPYHEAESILCHPDVVHSLQAKLSNLETAASKEQMIDAICEKCVESLLPVVAKRVFNRLTINLAVSAEKKDIAYLKNAEELITLVKKVAVVEHDKAASLTSQNAIEAIVKDEYDSCKSYIENRNIEKMLAVFEGKRLLSVMLPFSGCKSAVGMVKAMAMHLNPEAFPTIKALRDNLISGLCPATPGAE